MESLILAGLLLGAPPEGLRGDPAGVRLRSDVTATDRRNAVLAQEGLGGDRLVLTPRLRLVGPKDALRAARFHVGPELGYIGDPLEEEPDVSIPTVGREGRGEGFQLQGRARFTVLGDNPTWAWLADIRITFPDVAFMTDAGRSGFRPFDLSARLRGDIRLGGPVRLILRWEPHALIIDQVRQAIGPEIAVRLDELELRAGYVFANRSSARSADPLDGDAPGPDDFHEHRARVYLGYSIVAAHTLFANVEFAPYTWAAPRLVDRADSSPLTALAGWLGILGPVDVLLAGGIASTFHQDVDGFVGPIGRAQIGVRFDTPALLTLRYDRRAERHLWAHYRTLHDVSARYELRTSVGRELFFELEGGFQLIAHPAYDPHLVDPVAAFGLESTSPTRDETRIRAAMTLGMTFSVATVALNVRYDQTISDWSYSQGNFDFEAARRTLEVTLAPTFHW